jgi:hypothetical protein
MGRHAVKIQVLIHTARALIAGDKGESHESGIVIPETIDAICALHGEVGTARESTVRANTAFGVNSALI